MALFRRGKWWWCDFSVNGQRYRQPLRTKDWREAQAREKELITQASAGKLSPSGQQFARLSFGEAADRYIIDRTPHLAPKSVQSERERIRRLKDFFGATPLTRITGDAIPQYIAHRKGQGISNRTVNLELGILGRVLKRAKRWHLVADDLKPLPERRDVGRALSYEEKVRLVRMAASRPEWQVARLAMTLALNTTMRGCELKGLRWRDVDFMGRILAVRRSKTAAGERVIPLNADAMGAVRELWERAKVFGGTDPVHYVFPTCEGHTNPDPTRPMHDWRSAWRSLTRAAGLRGMRFHDLRHHAITELAESLTSDQTIMSIAGHVSPRMLAHYSHVRLEAKRKALDALSSGGSRGSYGTNHDTKAPFQPVPLPQLIEKNGGADETRTRDLLRDRQAF